MEIKPEQDRREDDMVSITDFKNIELITAKIISVQPHPDADRLYVLKVDTGKGEKQLVAGIRTSYTAEELAGRQIVMVNNLAPAVIRGVESQGMLLAAGVPGSVALLAPDRELPPGSGVR